MTLKVSIGFTADDIWVAGNTRRFTINVVDAAGSPKNLTGASSADWRFTDIAAEEGTPTVLLSKSLGSGVTITDAAQGEVTITVSGPDTESLQPGDYHAELRVVDAATDRESVTKMTIRLTGSLFAP
ncbi:MAG: hypothetical protein ACPHCN_12965 [Mycobacterium sp.]